MNLRKNNDIWYDLFKGILNYLSAEKYPLNDTGFEVLRIVDYVNEPIDNELNYTYINENIPGLTFVKEDNSVYNETKTLEQALVTGDTFTVDDITYFIDAEKFVYDSGDNIVETIPPTVHELNTNDLDPNWYSSGNNNTIIGDTGISVAMGNFYLDEKEDYSTWRTPQIIFQLGKLSNVNSVERSTTTRSKTQEFSIIILVKERDLYENQSGYDETNRVKSLLSSLLYDYFQSKQCAKDLPSISTLEWDYDFDIILEDRPIVLSIQENRLTFR